MAQYIHPQQQHRQLLVISGKFEDCVAMAKQRLKSLNYLWLSDTDLTEQVTLPMSKASMVLGQEYDVVVFDAFSSGQENTFNANAFGIVTGTIIGGGYLILLTPDLRSWADKSHFLQRFTRLLQQSSALFFDHKQPLPALTVPARKKVTTPLLFKDQQDAFVMMQSVISGHRRRPLVLTSDRGRGKSTLLGWFAAHLLEQGRTHIIVTAPSRKIAETVFQAAHQSLSQVGSEEKLAGLHFLSPDELNQQKPQADLILIDEAASIPLPLLERFIKQHSRLIFATTEHGYEGSGRGFALRFKKILDKCSPYWKSATLDTPCRWAKDDPLENFTFDALLLKTELADMSGVVVAKPTSYHVAIIKQDDLIADESLLRELFGLLLSAHYQTRPSDLVRLLDDKNYQIFVVRTAKKILATALVAIEGGFSKALADAIYNGKRRPQGHLIPQTLATHAGVKDAPCYLGERIIRIAVHPELQGQGIGSYLLRQIINTAQKNAKVDYIATSFGATPELVSFWHQAGLQTVQIGMKRDASSGTHSVVMLHPLNKKAELLYKRAQTNFAASLPLLLADPLRDLEAPLVAILFVKLFGKNDFALLELTDTENQALIGFYEQNRGYESSISAIYKLTLYRLSQGCYLSPEELQLLIAKVLQKKSWQQLVALTHATGRKQLISILRQTVKKLAYQY
ncbi:MAG: hypothetical protein DSZ29_07240 [Aquificaceae bacterium]|nr:MAG: hypothetical protein DSZ29_07240 [Aquificaceae bacterium]